jgi:MFS transporter, NNP family, nitrate/nitrite transporter
LPHPEAVPRGRTLGHWTPEDPAFWSRTGRRIARWNLLVSTLAVFVGLAVWMVWSVVVLLLDDVGFAFTDMQLFWLTALPALSGSLLRVVYALAVALVGGRTWTVFSTALLLLPAVGIALAVTNRATPFPVFVLLAVLCGVGGASFASSMVHVNACYPRAHKGMALGWTAGIGNLGVSAMQWLVPIVITMSVVGAVGGPPQRTRAGDEIWLQNAGLVWVPLILLVVLAAWLRMHDLEIARASLREQADVLRRKHVWLICGLYLGTFGSFIGFSAVFPWAIQSQFPQADALRFAFLGPLVGAASRPAGGWMADRHGGGRVTFWSFAAMLAAALGVVFFLRASDGPDALAGFVAMFLLIFAAAGVGNGSTFQMIPAILLHQHSRGAPPPEVRDAARRTAQHQAGAALGFASAAGGLGGFVIPLAYGYSQRSLGSAEPAVWGFALFYAGCLALTWWYYTRQGAEAPC